MTDRISMLREHYRATGLTDRIKSALAAITPEDQPLTTAQLAPLDQFHTRGILATTELAGAAGLEPEFACSTWAAASAAQRVISPPPSAAR